MRLITINPNNEPYYSEDFIKGFKCGAQRQFEADKSDADRPQGEWKRVSADKYVQHAYHFYRCSKCGYDHIGKTNYCPNCGSKMRGEHDD